MKGLLLFVFCLVGVSELRADQTVTVRSGNGPIGSQDTIVRVLPKGEGDITPTPADFIAVQSANFAWVNSPYATYIPSLPEDPNAKWIATTPNLSPQSALYAVPFQLTDSGISSATLDIRYAVDNAINGVFINGQRISGNSFDGDYHSEFRFVRSDVAPLLLPNATNWLYLNVSDYGGLAGLIFSATITTSSGGRIGVDPARGGNNGTVTVLITGSGFSDGAQVKLTALGQPDIIGSFPTVLSATQAIVTFDLRSAIPGNWTAVVTNPDQQIVFSAPFTVEVGGSVQLSVDVIGPSRVRAGREASFEAIVTNDGNVDAQFVNVSSSLAGTGSAQLVGTQLATAAAVPGCGFTQTNTFVGALSKSLRQFTCTVPAGCLLMHNTASDDQPDPCSEYEANVARIQNNLAVLQRAFAQLVAELITLEAQEAQDCTPVTASNAAHCADLLAQIASKKAAIEGVRAAIKRILIDLQNAQEQLDECRKRHPRSSIGLSSASSGTSLQLAQAVIQSSTPSQSTFQVCGVTSVDPNDKIGSIGSGTAQYVKGSGPLSYTILFENLPTASAPAAEVVVTDPLDASLDLSTLSVQNVRFGTASLDFPVGTQNMSTTWDLRPVKNLLVKIESTISAGVLSVKFTSLDPLTGQPSTDPLVGFLPPDQTPPEGEGSVFFVVQPKQGVQSGTIVRNKAQIIFDVNSPISTPEWFNTIDNTPPTSLVTSLPAAEVTWSFPVQWSGTDIGAGIQDFTVYVSDNGGPFATWLSQTTDLHATYSGVGGHTYSFFSIARDLVGNLENLKTSGEATTQVVVDTTPPQITPQISGSLGNNGWYTSNVTVRWSVTDSESGIASSSGCSTTTLMADTAGVTMTCSATNGAGLSSSLPLTIKIDKTPPTVACSASPSVLWPPNNKLVPIGVSVNVSDVLSGPAGFTLVSVTSNEPNSGQGDIQGFLTGPASTSGELRAQRLGSGTGRVYTLTYSGSDRAGNTATCTTTVSVPHDQGQN